MTVLVRVVRVGLRVLQRGFSGDPWQAVAIACIAGFSFLIFLMSAWTMGELLDMRGSTFVAILVASLVQSFASLNAVSMMQPTSKTDLLLAFATWAFLTLMSVITSWGAIFSGFGAKDYAQTVYATEIQKTGEVVATFTDRVSGAAQYAENLNKQSQDTAKVESSTGGSCGDGNRSGIKGSRFTRREKDAAELSAIAQHFRRKATEAKTVNEGLVAALRRYDSEKFADAERSFQDLFTRMRVISVDPEIARVKSWLQERIRIGREGWEENGHLYRCPDPVFESLAQRLIAALDLPRLAERPELFAPTTKNAIRDAYQGAFAKLLSFSFVPPKPDELKDARRQELTAPATQSIKHSIKDSIWLWVLAAAPDVLIVLASWRLAVRQRLTAVQDGPISRAFRMLLSWTTRAAPDLYYIARRKKHSLSETLDIIIPWVLLTPRFRRRKGATLDLFVPNAPVANEEIDSLRSHALFLEVIGAAFLVHAKLSVEKLDKDWQSRMAQVGADTYAHFELDRKFYVDLVLTSVVRNDRYTSRFGDPANDGAAQTQSRATDDSETLGADQEGEPAAPRRCANVNREKLSLDAVSALTGLGFPKSEAAEAVSAVLAETDQAIDLTTLIHLALKRLGGGGFSAADAAE